MFLLYLPATNFNSPNYSRGTYFFLLIFFHNMMIFKINDPMIFYDFMINKYRVYYSIQYIVKTKQHAEKQVIKKK